MWRKRERVTASSFPRSTACSSAAEKVSPSGKPPGMPDWRNQFAGAVQGDTFPGRPSPQPAPCWRQDFCFYPSGSYQSAVPHELAAGRGMCAVVVGVQPAGNSRTECQGTPRSVGQCVNEPTKKTWEDYSNCQSSRGSSLGFFLPRLN